MSTPTPAPMLTTAVAERSSNLDGSFGRPGIVRPLATIGGLFMGAELARWFRPTPGVARIATASTACMCATIGVLAGFLCLVLVDRMRGPHRGRGLADWVLVACVGAAVCLAGIVGMRYVNTYVDGFPYQPTHADCRGKDSGQTCHVRGSVPLSGGVFTLHLDTRRQGVLPVQADGTVGQGSDGDVFGVPTSRQVMVTVNSSNGTTRTSTQAPTIGTYALDCNQGSCTVTVDIEPDTSASSQAGRWQHLPGNFTKFDIPLSVR